MVLTIHQNTAHAFAVASLAFAGLLLDSAGCPAKDSPLGGPPRLPEGVVEREAGEYLNTRDGSILVWVPPGEFSMGRSSGPENETPQQRVVLTYGYLIGKYEVTFKQFASYVAQAAATDIEQAGRHLTPDADDRMPVAGVGLATASSYCRWAGGRLPTEAEWERAARGEDGRLFPWGKDPPGPTLANLSDQSAQGPLITSREAWDDGFATAAPVGSYPRGVSPFGCADMSGNVAEFALGYLGRYVSCCRLVDPGASHVSGRVVLRGGSWSAAAEHATTTWRKAFASDPGPGLSNVGFRLCIPLPRSDPTEQPNRETSLAPARVPDGVSQSEDGNWFNAADGSALVWVPAGRVRLPDQDADSYLAPQGPRLVDVRGFLIGRYEVTRSQYETFSRATGRTPPWKSVLEEEQPNLPVTRVSWEEAEAYCEWAHGRLPCEAEWVLAAVGSSHPAPSWDGSRRWNGAHDDGFPFFGPVGIFPDAPSAFGCLNMAGNVSEWAWDRGWSVSRASRLVLGGAWNTERWDLRRYERQNEGHTTVGFRIVVSLQ